MMILSVAIHHPDWEKVVTYTQAQERVCACMPVQSFQDGTWLYFLMNPHGILAGFACLRSLDLAQKVHAKYQYVLLVTTINLKLI